MHSNSIMGTALSLACCASNTLGFALLGRLPHSRFPRHHLQPASMPPATAPGGARTTSASHRNARLIHKTTNHRQNHRQHHRHKTTLTAARFPADMGRSNIGALKPKLGVEDSAITTAAALTSTSTTLRWTRGMRGGGGGGTNPSLSTASSSSMPSSFFASSAAATPEKVEATVGGGDSPGAEASAAADEAHVVDDRAPVIFVLGGPGSGKGTQCERLASEYGYVHLSAGELLRQERESGSKDGKLIDEYIREGRIVPVAISLGLLQRAMKASGPFSRFLIDGFPRNSDNFQGWYDLMTHVADVRCVLFLHCPEEELERRLLSRGQSSGRTDDNAETARRRFQTFVETTMPIVEEFERKGMLVRVNGFQDKGAVFRDVRLGLRAALEREVLDANSAATEALAKGDSKTYAQMCTPDMTTATGTGMTSVDGELAARQLSRGAVAKPFVRMLSGPAAIVFSERQVVRPGGDGEEGAGGELVTWQESRVWEVHEGRWKCVHCHGSSDAPLW